MSGQQWWRAIYRENQTTAQAHWIVGEAVGHRMLERFAYYFEHTDPADRGWNTYLGRFHFGKEWTFEPVEPPKDILLSYMKWLVNQ